MFGLSLPKLLVLALIIAAIWYGYKWVGRVNQRRKATPREVGSQGGDRQDLVRCAACGTYGTTGLDRCPEGRDDCPLVKG